LNERFEHGFSFLVGLGVFNFFDVFGLMHALAISFFFGGTHKRPKKENEPKGKKM